MLSEFGKFCRKLRIEQKELLDMPQKLNVKPSFFTCCGDGKKSILEQWKQKYRIDYFLFDYNLLLIL